MLLRSESRRSQFINPTPAKTKDLRQLGRHLRRNPGSSQLGYRFWDRFTVVNFEGSGMLGKINLKV